MHSWPQPQVPSLGDARFDVFNRASNAGTAHSLDDESSTSVPLRLYDTADQKVSQVEAGPEATMYVCGITPYDATHLGHAATYLTFDLIYRQLLDNGHSVHYVQNITDVDDPLFERAERDGVDWRELGTSQIDLFRSDMENLSVIPPRDYIGAIESVDEVVEMVEKLLENGSAYQLTNDEYPDVYFRKSATENFGYESNYSAEQMAEFFAERGGDPDRPGKEDPLDALVWRAARPGEPSWNAPFGAGRPGWHIECSAIATNRLGKSFDIQGGGSDLAFPHHEFSAAHAEAATGCARMASHYVHAGMIALDGVKMSKSLGNLVFVSKLVAAGVDPSAIRIGVFASHYRSDRDWSDEVLEAAKARLETWRAACAATKTATDEKAVSAAAALVADVRASLANDLDTPAALDAIDAWAAEWSSATGNKAEAGATEEAAEAGTVTGAAGAGEFVATALDALLGVKL
ncbi:cysteine--1-D-myo-inosityl 2-amino-2-deoxy-alpha-D-glucopyranoside ligase [Corynebacterium amycolatum]|uniref:L-cysteine:1D-myo-inositol 2-amino-2-deoxy-alpha-D-glucopyranoside ligase n=1 Tax=Corynebacterium amycolatum TaxID=43765 RepID=A0AB38XTT7_CORAY|nr:cysteine--1-D-myo-inosityl 2-amino-2-deoxy-alpha-D-glucopyranoside ligase [Corynebacterium amycolatum]MBC6727019.1 cysteine--1-D-myo-inosityl 2-amino-2-deoxy-alpha-D-glucopyranoside ligase [Corynebacterium amycolatum]QRP16102.1 cysteine--1-D-myo-inosityl 2-amino-2-deoxy-alpha-D-glucopyranoside ligase [Corynebacterium amycolatum]WET43336.1 cysteine--1-D-myo-inosityl 2-amino-2-deoxy-alpha-D-glucopyranoside ligase [Corynebacterium amycolatum]